MRDRHLPRLCRACAAPMARQEETCWSCGAAYAPAQPAGRPDVPVAERLDDDGGRPARPLVAVAS